MHKLSVEAGYFALFFRPKVKKSTTVAMSTLIINLNKRNTSRMVLNYIHYSKLHTFLLIFLKS